ncbi:MAG: UDP-glucose 4-epimerase GalE [Alphaproteobacteria bacterium]
MPVGRGKILVTGGAGYIGSHVVRQLRADGRDVVVYDNLSTGHGWAVADTELLNADLANRAALAETFGRHRFEAVLHFAASIDVAESVRDPLKYYFNNTRNTLNLLRACEEFSVDRFVFSSSAAVYGQPPETPIAETAPLAPVSPYGASKQMSERALNDLAEAGDLRYVCLRYFNVAGADPSGTIGESHEPETHLIPLALQTASGKRARLTLYGDDYATRDGTCIRDYIHVVDLARAHVDALRYLESGAKSETLNCGYGRGWSVAEIIAAVEDVTGAALSVVVGPRRAGDPPELIAANERIKRVLGWRPRHDDMRKIVKSAWAWEQRRDEIEAAPRGQGTQEAG